MTKKNNEDTKENRIEKTNLEELLKDPEIKNHINWTITSLVNNYGNNFNHGFNSLRITYG